MSGMRINRSNPLVWGALFGLALAATSAVVGPVARTVADDKAPNSAREVQAADTARAEKQVTADAEKTEKAGDERTVRMFESSDWLAENFERVLSSSFTGIIFWNTVFYVVVTLQMLVWHLRHAAPSRSEVSRPAHAARKAQARNQAGRAT